jgi:hypothetical protein
VFEKRMSHFLRPGWSLAAVVVGAVVLISSSAAAAGSQTKVVRFHGYALTVPISWPVFNLARHPSQCVRFNRHAVYLGHPGRNQACPTQAAGRTEAILMQPLRGSFVASRGGRAALPSVSVAGADPTQGTMAQIVRRRAGVLITATWNRDPGLIARAVGVRSVAPAAVASRVRPRAAGLTMTGQGRPASAAHGAYIPGEIYTGKGFDVCSTPSPSRMSAWRSAYHAVGVYIGGTNMACGQRNLTSTWVSDESGVGWHVIPIYVGLQAPKNECGCASITPGSAIVEGQAAAEDAAAQARSLGLGTGNPIYDDMEGYRRTSSNTSAVLAFLAAWTQQLHSEGYKSGVYSSDDSGIRDLVSKYGGSYPEPNELWIANWNGKANTSDPNVPSHEWADHQRLHQYKSDTETHGGVRMNIDRDYVDAATAAPGGNLTGPPVASAPPRIAGSPTEGSTLVEEHGSWSGSPTSYSYQWQDCNTAGGACTSISGAVGQRYVLRISDVGRTVRVLERATNSHGTGLAAASAHTAVVTGTASVYWLYNGYGQVFTSSGATFYGSPFKAGARESHIIGMTGSPNGRGYWLVDWTGRVFHYGDAASHSMRPALNHTDAVVGIVATPTGGYWLFTRYGNVYTSSGTPWYGSPAAHRAHERSIVGMTATPDGKGYWLVDSSGRVYNYGDAPRRVMRPSLPRTTAIRGIVATPGGCYWLFTRYGNVYTSTGAKWYGSPAAQRAHQHSVVGMTTSSDRKGYWLANSSGRVFHFGDAPSRRIVPGLSHAHPIKGIAG